MNLKTLFLGAFIYFLVSLALAFLLGIPDEAFFEELYKTAPMWRGELSDSSYLFTAWILHKMIFALGVSTLFQWVGPTMTGPSWRRGALFGLATCPLIWATYLGLWTIFSLPGVLWIWWGIYYLVISIVAGAAMGKSVAFFTSRITKGIQAAKS